MSKKLSTRARDLAQWFKFLPGNCEVVSSIPSTKTKNKILSNFSNSFQSLGSSYQLYLKDCKIYESLLFFHSEYRQGR